MAHHRGVVIENKAYYCVTFFYFFVSIFYNIIGMYRKKDVSLNEDNDEMIELALCRYKIWIYGPKIFYVKIPKRPFLLHDHKADLNVWTLLVYH